MGRVKKPQAKPKHLNEYNNAVLPVKPRAAHEIDLAGLKRVLGPRRYARFQESVDVYLAVIKQDSSFISRFLQALDARAPLPNPSEELKRAQNTQQNKKQTLI